MMWLTFSGEVIISQTHYDLTATIPLEKSYKDYTPYQLQNLDGIH